MVSICVKIVRLKKGKLVFDRFIYPMGVEENYLIELT